MFNTELLNVRDVLTIGLMAVVFIFAAKWIAAKMHISLPDL